MFSQITLNDVLLTMAAGSFLLGMTTFLSGLVIILTRVLSRDMRTLSLQTAKLAQKGSTEGVSGLVGNASILVNALSNLVRTAAGVGVFMILMGTSLMVASYVIVIKMQWPA